MENKEITALHDFIASFCEKMKIKNIDLSSFNTNTSIDGDLNIFDLDIDLFIQDFAAAFNINISNFKWGNKINYPKEEEMGGLYSFCRMFDYRKKWVKKICHRLYTPKIIVSDLLAAIKSKELI